MAKRGTNLSVSIVTLCLLLCIGLAKAEITEQAKLLAPDGNEYDLFGRSVSISGDYAIVSAYFDDDNGSNSGSAYIFKHYGTSWSEQAKLVASDGNVNDYFGCSVSISGDYAIVGAKCDDDNGESSGSAYVFKRNGPTWSQQAKLLPSDGAAGDYFGISVSISGDYAIVGAYYDDDNGFNSGSAYIFKRGGASWIEQAKLTASDGAQADFFGESVSISGDYAIVGAHCDDDRGTNSGSAYIFKRDDTSWSNQAKLLPSDGAEGDYFGLEVSINGDYAVVGALYNDDNGSNSGSAYIFRRDGTNWSEQAKLLASDGTAEDRFGISASISGDYAIVGAYFDHDNGSDSGSAYLFKRDGSSWREQAKLLASDGAGGDYFSLGISINGDYAIIGAPYSDSNGSNSGSAYVFSGITTLHVPSEYPTIQTAIDAAVNGDTVIVAPGTYTGTGNRDIDFLGKAITVQSTNPEDPCVVAATIIDCNGTEAEPHRGFYFHSGENTDSVLSGLTIIDGSATYGSETYGAGIRCENSSPTITNCVFKYNTTYNDCCGGGMYNYNSDPTVTNCTFNRNSSPGDGRGGGIYNNFSDPIVTNCTFNKNLVFIGGGMYNDSISRPIVSGCTFSGNSGRGMHNSSSSPKVTNCIFSNNSGGGMYNYYGYPIITNCTFSGNEASYAGGGIGNSSSGATVTNCTFSRNSAGYGGGGMSNGGSGSPTITNCIFSGNEGGWGGGGMYNNSGSNPTITNCTFNDNSASFGGGMNNKSSNPTLTNCILWGNAGAEIYNSSGSSPTVTFSDIQYGFPGAISADPCFVNAAGGNLHLLPNSPCINKGNPSFVPEPNETDIDGESRVMLGRVDMGADEFNPFEIAFDVIDKTRLGRTVFEYDCNVILTNISTYSVNDVQLEIIAAPDNMDVIDPNVTFGDIEIAPTESAASLDTCTFQIDRSVPTDSADIIWPATYHMNGTLIEQFSSLSSLSVIPGDIDNSGQVNFEDVYILTDQWLEPPGTPPADIAPFPTGDDFVDFLDFAVLADNWLKGIPE